MPKKVLMWLILAVMVMASSPEAARSSEPVTLKLAPGDIRIGAFFNGVRVSVSGTIPAASELMVQVTGKREDLVLKKKGRALGALWMNLGSVTFRQVPTLYLLYVSEAIGAFARSSPAKWRELGFGLESLRDHIGITSDHVNKDELYNEFLKLKEGEALYAMRETPMHYGKSSNGMRSFTTEIFIPARVPPGIYRIKALAVNDGHVVGAGKDEIRVKEVGVPQFLSSLSFNHGGLYGFLAVLIAVGAGLLMDFLFGGQKGSH